MSVETRFGWMTPIDAAALFVALFLPLNWIVLRHFRELRDPAYLSRHGVVIVADGVLEARSDVVGEYMGRPIWASVTFMGLVYRFDRVQPPARREALRPGELFLDPGLVYVL